MKQSRFIPDVVDGQWVVFDMRGGGVNARFGSAPSRDLIIRQIVGTLASVDGLTGREIAALTHGLSARRATAILEDSAA